MALACGSLPVCELWNRPGVDNSFRRVLRNGRPLFEAEQLVRVMVLNRLSDASCKLGVMRWRAGARVPGVEASSVTHHRRLRTMDTIADRADGARLGPSGGFPVTRVG